MSTEWECRGVYCDALVRDGVLLGYTHYDAGKHVAYQWFDEDEHWVALGESEDKEKARRMVERACGVAV